MRDRKPLRIRLAGLVVALSWHAGCSPPAPPAVPKVSRAIPETAPVKIAPAPVDPPSPIRFRDATESSGITFVHRSGKSAEKYYPSANGSGVAMIDYDGDGLLDLYFPTTRSFPLDAPSDSPGNRLYRNKGGGSFEDVTEKAGVGFNGFCHGASVGDVNGDGAPDLYLTNLGRNVLYINKQDGTFRRAVTFGAEVDRWSSGSAFLDYDGDGDLDLYVTCYGVWSEAGPHDYCGDFAKKIRTYCSPKSITPERHYLFRNDGAGVFEDVAEAAGVLRRDGRGLGVIAADVNRDGKPDLYVANDMCPNFLFLNKGGGAFEDVSDSSGASLSEAGHAQASMGVDVEDVDGDGLPELFATNFEGDYNTLYRNLDGRNFQDVSASAGIVRDALPYVGWGCSLADFDNDGYPDIFVVNGHVDDNLELLGRPIPWAEPAKVWRNVGGARFRTVQNPGPFFDRGHSARGAAFGDLDNDGDVDAVVSRLDDKPAILINESDRGNWIRLVLKGSRSNRQAIGASVAVHASGRVLRRQVKGGGSYLSANDPRPLVGIGESNRVEHVEVRWPSGEVSILKEPAVNSTHIMEEPRSGRTP